MITVPEHHNGMAAALISYSHVLRALLLRDIKSRFLGSAWGYLLSIAWPLSHILLLLIIHGVFGRVQPYGDSAAVWYSTGIVPFMAFSYTLRFIVLGLIQNSPLLSFPVVKVTDIVFARALVEIFSVFLVFCILVILLNSLEHRLYPSVHFMLFMRSHRVFVWASRLASFLRAYRRFLPLGI